MNSIQNDKKKLMVIKDPEIKDFFMKDLSNYVKKNNITCDGKTYYIFFEKMSVIISRTKNLKEKNSLDPYTEKTFYLKTFLFDHGFVDSYQAQNYMERINKTDEYDDDGNVLIKKPIDKWDIYDNIEEVYKDDVKIWFHKDINKIIEDFINEEYNDVVVYI